MKNKVNNKITETLLNLIKVKTIVTFSIVGILIYSVLNNKIDDATLTAIIMIVFQNLFNKKKGDV